MYNLQYNKWRKFLLIAFYFLCSEGIQASAPNDGIQFNGFRKAAEYSKEDIQVPLDVFKSFKENGSVNDLYVVENIPSEKPSNKAVAKIFFGENCAIACFARENLSSGEDRELRNALSDPINQRKEVVFCAEGRSAKAALTTASNLYDQYSSSIILSQIKVITFASLPMFDRSFVDSVHQRLSQDNILAFYNSLDPISEGYQIWGTFLQKKGHYCGTPIGLLALDRWIDTLSNPSNLRQGFKLAVSCMPFLLLHCGCTDPLDILFMASPLIKDLILDQPSFSFLPSVGTLDDALDYTHNRLSPDDGFYTLDEVGIPRSILIPRKLFKLVYGA